MMFFLSAIRIKRQLTRMKASNEGSAAVEFSLVAIPFFLLLFAMTEIGITMFADQVLETGTQDVSRLILTNQIQKSMKPQTTNGKQETEAEAATRAKSELQSALCAKINTLFDCSQIQMDLRSFPSATAVSLPDPNNCQVSPQFSPGNPGDLVILRVFYQWQTFVTMLNFGNCPSKARLLISTAAVMNQ